MGELASPGLRKNLFPGLFASVFRGRSGGFQLSFDFVERCLGLLDASAVGEWRQLFESTARIGHEHCRCDDSHLVVYGRKRENVTLVRRAVVARTEKYLRGHVV